ncbi:MAG TPA: Uma2 family endonuclease [Pyrinomonadaceae bacterium]|jgi:Uma2 family endonuclease|nr:Uma2 family endonuclease [Pyrinomonadaceae bacterium]
MSATTQLKTAEELLKLPRGRFRYELVNGELRRMSPAGHNHGRIAARLTVSLGQHVEENNLGEVYAAETGFKLRSDPDTVRAPDVAFVRRERVDEAGEMKGYFPGAPDLAVEVNSPDDTVREVEEKVAEWLEYGARLVWIISPKLHNVTVYRSLADVRTLTERDALDGEDVVPGFNYPVAKLFAARSSY